ncbi:hypothetical protein [Streptomyces sp. NPDC003077]|uniref:hypothetical protein n=1 Tax=Streptomyces sp. NPDC003077 TaxID=3154443 RepID=UPI0033BA1D33
MSLHDELTTAQRHLDELVRSVDRVAQRFDGGLHIRRVRSDMDHLREDLALLREAAAGAPRGRSGDPASRLASAPGAGAPASSGPGPEMVTIPDTPYDASLWVDAEDEGLGARDRRAP